MSEAATFDAKNAGTPEAPVTIRSESVGGCVLSGSSTAFSFRPGSRHVVVSGFEFRLHNETATKLAGACRVRLTRCVFRLEETDSFDWLVVTGAGSRDNRVDHCLFQGKRQPGNYITIDGDSQGQQSQHDRIDHNLFLDNGPRANNEKEAIRVGWSKLSLSSGHTVIENNYFERCDGDPEIISVKSCDNIVRYNTVHDSRGVVSLRHGDRNAVYGNVIRGVGRAGCGGFRIYGADHRVYNNYLADLTGEGFDAALAITNGDADAARPGARLSAHFRPCRVQVVHNTLVDNAASIEIGHPRTGKKPWRKAPRELLFSDNLVVSHRGALVKTFTPAEGSTWRNNLFWPTGDATLGTDAAEILSQVGDPQLVKRVSFLIPTNPGRPVDASEPLAFAAHDLAMTKRGGSAAVGAIEPADTISPLAPQHPSDVGPFANR